MDQFYEPNKVHKLSSKLIQKILTSIKQIMSSTKPYDDISVDEFRKLMDQEDTVILDVRTDDEFAQGHIEDAIQINLYGNFKEQVEELDRDKHYLVYCRSGNRSGKACSIMHSMGFEQKSNLKGGIIDWQSHHSLENS